MKTRFFPRVLFLLFFILLLSVIAYADCCTYQGRCNNVSAGCPAGYFVSGQSCSALADCKIGCCCDEGKARKKAECANPNSFFENPSLFSGQTCSCDGGYAVSGFVKKNGQNQGGAAVSAGTITNVSSDGANLGAFTLYGIPAGPVTISASHLGCTGSVQIPNLQGDRTGVLVEMRCDCTPGCVPSSTSYCDNNRVLHPYDVSNQAQWAEYCLYCGDVDTQVCGEFSDCKPGDGVCPLGCSAVESNPKFDPDCACIPVKNGYCPPGCNADTDGDCGIIFNFGCGDGLIFYPYETCEPGPPAGQSVQPGQVSFCESGECSNCNCISASECGNRVINAGEQCELGMVCADGNQCLACKCSEKCSNANLNPTLTSGFDRETRKVSLRWSLTDACDSLVTSYYLYSCKKEGTNLCRELSAFPVEATYPRGTFEGDVLVSENSDYSFYLKVFYSDSREGISRIVNVKTGSDFCMNRDPGAPAEFCSDNKRSTCDSNNNVKTLPDGDCGAKQMFCSGPDYSGTTRCEASDACSLCNGLFGLYGKFLDLKVPLGSEKYFCLPGSGREVVPGCYFDKTRFLFDAFSSCGSVKSCYDFKSQAACTDPLDPCGVNSDCEWIPFPSNPSVGGVCRPKSASLQDCTLCDQPGYNWITPACTPETCNLFGTCYYQGVNNSPSCANRVVSNCLKYDGEDSCIGSGSNARAVKVDALYGPNNTRLGGSNAVTKSNDELGLGKCYWDDTNEKCRRDADGLPVDTAKNTGFDCAKGDLLCESDFSSPETTILATHMGLYSAKPSIVYEVEDNYPSNRMLTYFCTAPGNAASCYPRTLGVVSASKKEYVASDLVKSGTYKLYYYSEDPAKNLEVVKSMTMLVDADPPFIELIYPRNESEFAVNTLSLSIQARTSPDAKFVCANNTVLKKTSCVNNCAIPGATTPCIDNKGLFTITVPVIAANTSAGSSTPRSILFYAEDFAGNRFSNTLLGIIYDISAPGAPTITITAK